MKKAIVFLTDGFEECEGLIVVDLLRRAGIKTIMASTTGQLDVISSRHIIIKADALVEDTDFDDADMIILPGGRLGTENLWKSALVKAKCCEFASSKYIAAICAAPSILARLSLLDGKLTTCHPDYESSMPGAVLTGKSIEKSGNIITGQGLGSTFAFAFELIRIMMGEATVKQIQKAICYHE